MNRCFKNRIISWRLFWIVSFFCFSACTIGERSDFSGKKENASAICGNLAVRPSVKGEVFKKELPNITFKNLTPPFKHYAYFQSHESFPFEYQASSFSLINAWWLAEASMLVYADENYVRRRFHEAGLDRVKFFDSSGSQFYIASNNWFAIVAFRGSEIWKRNETFDPKQIINDLRTDIDIRMSDWARGGKVHSGFKWALDKAWHNLLPEMDHLQSRGLSIWITGHSLGGALAILAADRLQNVQGVYTFGSPRIGNEAFRDNFRVKAFRVVNGKDIVPHIPLKIRYRHVGKPVFIDSNGRLIYPSDPVETGRDYPSPEASHDSKNEEPIQKVRSSLFIPTWIRDHVPLLYSVLVWNELVERKNVFRRR